MILARSQQSTSSTEDETYLSLLRALRRRKGFGIVFVQCSPSEAEQLVSRLKMDISQKHIDSIQLEGSIDNLYDLIRKHLSVSQSELLFIRGLEKSLKAYIEPGFGGDGDYYNLDTVPPVLSHLNQRRELFRDNFRNTCFIFSLPAFAIKYFIRRAPDFFDWSTGVYTFSSEQKLSSSEALSRELDKVINLRSGEDYSKSPSQNLEETLLKIQRLVDVSEDEGLQMPELFFEKGLILQAMKRYQEAMSSYEKSIKIDDSNREAHNNLGVVLAEAGSLEKSVKSYEKAIEIDSRFYDAWYNRGNALRAIGNFSESIESYSQSIKIKPDNQTSWDSLLQTLLEADDREAKELLIDLLNIIQELSRKNEETRRMLFSLKESITSDDFVNQKERIEDGFNAVRSAMKKLFSEDYKILALRIVEGLSWIEIDGRLNSVKKKVLQRRESPVFLMGVAAKGIEALITDTTRAASSSAISNAVKGWRDKDSQVIFEASRRYIENYQKRHCQIKVLGMREPVDLAAVYTGVKLLDSRDILQFDPEALEETFRQTRLRGYSSRGREEEKQSGITIANQKQYSMVLGGPGAGKSTFLRKVGLEALRTFYYEDAVYRPRVIPVLLELKRFEKNDVDIAKFIAAEFETCGFPEAEAFMQNALMQGNLLIMLDGLDEVPSANLDNVLKTIRDFVDRYDGNRFIASCRVAASGYRGSAFARFSDVTMADFDDEQIQQFINNWFSSEQDRERETADKCWEVLQKPENRASKELAHTPLLLTYLCLVYNLSQRFPNNRSSLYKKALRILLEEWAAEKRILRDEIYEGLSIEQEEILLSEIAYDGMKADQLFFDKRWLSNQIRNFLVSNLNAPKSLDSEKVLNAIEVQQGILVERMKNQYSFSHLTLQEYLAAQYLVDNNEWKSLVQQHITDSRWREIFLLLPGLMSGRAGADSLLQVMKAQADSYINTPRLEALVQWAETAIDRSDKESRPSAKRSIAVFLILALAHALEPQLSADYELEQALNIAFHNALDFILEPELSADYELEHTLDIARDLALNGTLSQDLALSQNLACAFARMRTKTFHGVEFEILARSLEGAQNNKPNWRTSREKKEKFSESIYGLWCSALGIDPETTRLSTEESQSLANYFNICELMIRCKESATRVSPQKWEAIESSILTVPTTAEDTAV